jgi:hypothetical protein
MPWTPFQTAPPAKFIAITGFRAQAQQVRNFVGAHDQGAFDAAVTAVVQAMTAGAMGCTGLVYVPDPGDIRDYLERGVSRLNLTGVAHIRVEALLQNPAAVATARQVLVRLAFVDLAGQFTQHFP